MPIKSKNLKRVKSKEFYVDNSKFLKALIDYKKEVNLAKENSQPIPRLPEYIGECFINIAKKLSNRPNFVNYIFKEDMISDGIENSLQAVNNFDPTKSENPFAYFTQIISFAFIRRIKKERTQLYTKFKIVEHSSLHNEPYNRKYINDKSDENMRDFIEKFEASLQNKK